MAVPKVVWRCPDCQRRASHHVVGCRYEGLKKGEIEKLLMPKNVEARFAPTHTTRGKVASAVAHASSGGRWFNDEFSRLQDALRREED